MPQAQPGIFEEQSRHHYHLELGLTASAETASALAAVRSSADAAGSHVVFGFGPRLWASMAGPESGEFAPLLEPFSEVTGPTGRFVPATQHDLWIWFHGAEDDVHFDLAREALRRLGGDVRIDQPCFVYRDNRDMTGFMDGTENPKGDDRGQVALIPEGGAGAGGTYAMTIRWLHNLDAFEALPVEEQERVIGRTKPDSRQLADDVMPGDSHVSRVVVVEDGEELEIYRRSTPFGTMTEHGLFFVAFSSEPRRFTVMLSRMFGLAGDGISDRITEFSRPVSGSFWYVPSVEVLENL